MINYSGISESRVLPVLGKITSEKDQSIVIVSSDGRAKRLASDLSFFADGKEILTIPKDDGFFLRYEAKNHDLLIQRLKALKALETGEPVIIIVPVSAAIKHITPHESFAKKAVSIEAGKIIDMDGLKSDLIQMGYERMDMVDGRGQFSIRGGIIDCFTPDSDHPYRIELFGDEVDSIRTFDEESQRSIENLRKIEIYPAEQIIASDSIFENAVKNIEKEYTAYAKKLEKKLPEHSEKVLKTRDELVEYVKQVSNLQLLENYLHYFYEETEYIWDYMKDGNIIIDDPDRIYEQLELMETESKADFEVLLQRGQVIPNDEKSLTGSRDFKKVLTKKNVSIFTPFPKKIQGIETYDRIVNLNSRQVLQFEGKLNVFESELKTYLKKGYEVIIVCQSVSRLENLREFVDREELKGKISFREGNLSAGIDYPAEKKVWISENDIFAAHKQKKKKKFKDKGEKFQSFSDMKEGDYVVHENHGIGKFEGIQQLSLEGNKKDYIKIKYAGNDMLYVPVDEMDMVQKYIGGDNAVPKLNKLSGGEWKATKQKAKAEIAVMAKDLIDLYAKRTMNPGHAFQRDTVWQREFEDAFPFQETDDQLRAVEEIKADMEKPFSMDRLLCGDVGFGKTEVAARAIFKCLSESKQAAILVPTTILADQHYYTLKERFENFPFNVEVLSRFKTKSQQSEIIKKLEKGEVDLIIGTHRLLSKDVKFKDLGLLVVDEEQRFGVEDKETIKKLKTNVDVLTLSATPIPRTLNMSLTGIKDMSLIEEPPEERYPVQTYVLEQDDQLLKEVIERELDRGGQVYVVFNRVRGINQIAEKIEALVPEARVSVGHGQMNENMLEKTMLEFINGETNVLVSTTIVESGLDIPNANTMVIMDSDRYGLAQLYQLRGRVGRSNRMAYAYLMYKKDKVLNEQAEKRLKAIREFTEFGAGFKVAMKDLEIRGAGNLLGTAQSGHILNIGYELYCKMVDDAVRALQGEIINDSKEETSVDLPLSAYIPEIYIENETLKLQMYKKIAAIRSDSEEDEIIDELTDRFGDVPKATMNLIRISHIRYLAQEIGAAKVHNVVSDTFGAGRNMSGQRMKPVMQKVKIAFEFGEKNLLNGFALFNLSEEMGQKVFVHAGTKPMIRLTTDNKSMLDDTLKVLKILFESKKSGNTNQNVV